MSRESEKPPFGWAMRADGSLVRVPDEQRVLKAIGKCRAAGMGWRAISQILAERAQPRGDVAAHDLVAVLRDMRAVSGDPLVVEVCDDAAAVIENMADRLVRQAHELEVAEARREVE